MNSEDRVGKELELLHRLRQAIQFCKSDNELAYMSDLNMPAEDRMKMEQCLVKNYLIPKGLDYFGKRDLIYIDM